MKYQVVSSANLETLESRINQLISEGWELQGGVSVSIWKYAVRYAQAVYKEESDE